MSADPELAALRAEIDALDRTLVEVLAARREAVQRIAAHKKARGLPALDAAREASLIDAATARARERGVPVRLVREVLAAVFADSHDIVQG